MQEGEIMLECVRTISLIARMEVIDMSIITATQLKNGLGFYLEQVRNGESFIVTKDGIEVCELKPRIDSKLAIFDSLTGIAKGVDYEEITEERLGQK